MKRKIDDPSDQILRTPLLNKGTGFSQKERDALGLNGLLPCKISTIKEQIERNYHNLCIRRTPLGKYEFLNALLNRNEILFYLFAKEHVEEVMQYIYTPTVGEAALQYSMIYKQRRGLYLSYPLRDKMEEMIANIPEEEVDVAVVTDGERILGLGDQGIGGMAIPVGKLTLYTLFGGIHPGRTLPIILDVGTNNEKLLESELYLGYRAKRVRGKEYDAFIERFVKALKKRFPSILLQWEDFGRENARPLLDRYREKILSFNDDIQGTASIALAAILAAIKVEKGKISQQKIVIFGGGSAGTGIADAICKAMVASGMEKEEALSKIFVIDIHGLIHKEQKDLFIAQKPFAKSPRELKDWKLANQAHISLLDVVKNAHPTVLIGVSAQSGAFTEEVVKEMAKHTRVPIIFPLSNPTSKAEAFPEEIIEWTKGKAIIASGTPFLPVEYEGKTYAIAQCNNVYIFPGLGLGAIVSKARSITIGMFLEAAETLASFSPALKNPQAPILPPLKDLNKISKEIALAVAKKAIAEGVSDQRKGDMKKAIEKRFWSPEYDTFSR